MSVKGDFAEVLREAGQSFEPDLGTLVAAGLREGRRRGRRRAAAQLAGASALVLAAVVGATQVVGAGPDGPARPGTVRPQPDRSPTVSAPVTGRQMLDSLEHELPTGTITQSAGRGTDGSINTGAPGPSGAPMAYVVWDDGHGQGRLDLTVTRALPGAADGGGVSCPDSGQPAHSQCVVSRLADGSRFLFEQARAFRGTGSDVQQWTGYLTAPDGMQVVLREWNAPLETSNVATRSAPPLNSAQLQTVLGDPEWVRAFAALQALGPATSPAVPADLTGADILATLQRLLPSGIATSDQDGSVGFAQLHVDDGHGAVLLEVNVQHWNLASASDAAGIAPVFAGATVLPNGDRLRQVQGGAGGNDVASWTADLLQSDGLRVSVTELNSPSLDGVAIRSTPVLTPEQLRSIVTSPLWK